MSWKLVAVKAKGTVADLCTAAKLPYAHGCGFYQLGKSENVSTSKLLVACDEESGEVIAGYSEVRDRLKLPNSDKISPRNVPAGWTLYVNSTSINRQLTPGATALVRVGGAPLSGVVEKPADNAAAAAGDVAGGLVPAATRPKRARIATPEKQQPPSPASAKPHRTEAAPVASGAKPPAPAVAAAGGAAAMPHFASADGFKFDGTLLLAQTGHPSAKPWKLDSIPAPTASTKVAAFDYDGCLAKTSLFRKGPDAWSLLYPADIPEAFKELLAHGYRLVIMSNQSEIGKATKTKENAIAEKKARFSGLVSQVGCPFLIMAATCKSSEKGDPYRKPAAGMWRYLESTCNGGLKVDKTRSFYCGDAAGRKGDHSDSDKAMAKAFGVPFFTEDVCFKERAYRQLFKL